MLVIKHGVNTLEELVSVPTEFGVHADIRPYKNSLILNSEPFVEGVDFEEYLGKFGHKFLVLELKSDGIEGKIIDVLGKFGIQNYFLLNAPPTSIKKLLHRKFTKFAVRFSDIESIETSKIFEGKAEWVWADIFRDFTLDAQTVQALKKNFKVCIVSPELIGLRAAVERYKGKLYQFNIDAVCTNLPEIWK